MVEIIFNFESLILLKMPKKEVLFCITVEFEPTILSIFVIIIYKKVTLFPLLFLILSNGSFIAIV